jgi:AraC-like DNA-binding protein
MFYLIEGSCDLLIKNTVYHLKPGNITFIPSNTLHRTTYTDSEFHERLYIEFTSNYINELVTQFGTGWLYNNLFSKIFYLPEEYRGDINRLLSRIIIEQQSSDNFSQCMTKMYFQELIIKLLRYIKDSSVLVLNGSASTNESLATAINYINENFRNDITLDDMAELLHLNPSYFSKKFKSLNGLGFKEYLNNVRINHSEKLLLETNMSITEIAFECGYDNSNYFGDAFKKINNVSPSKFRRLKGNVQD